MAARPAGALQQRPEGLSKWAVVAFYPEYCAGHPLWVATGLADLETMHLPGDLNARLRGWTEYWDTHFHWDSGWATGHPQAWWTEEGTRLPRAVASALGADFAVAVDSGFIHSKAPAAYPSAAEAMAIYVHDHEAQFRQVRARPGRFTWSAD